MQRKLFSNYKLLLRAVGIAFLLTAFYFAIRDCIEYFQVNGMSGSQSLNTVIPNLYVVLLGRGIYFYIAAALLLLSFTSLKNAKIFFVSLQAATWLIGISLWYQQSHFFRSWLLPGFFIPISLHGFFYTLFFSLGFLMLYIPIVYALKGLFHPRTRLKQPNQESYIQAVNRPGNQY
jgi:hypothetical protein